MKGAHLVIYLLLFIISLLFIYLTNIHGTLRDKIMASRRRPRPNPRDLWICWVTWERGTKVIDRMKVADQLTLRRQVILDYPGGSNVTTRDLSSVALSATVSWELLSQGGGPRSPAAPSPWAASWLGVSGFQDGEGGACKSF